MKYQKSKLLTIAKKVKKDHKLTPSEIEFLLAFEKKQDSQVWRIIKLVALPMSLALGFFYSVYPEYFATIVSRLPSWTNLPPNLLDGIDYLWDFLGEPVKKANLLYHIPNIVLYAFGIAGIKKLIDAINQRSWLDLVLTSKSTLQESLQKGKPNIALKDGHSILFVGNGDFIGAQFAIDAAQDNVITVAQTKPAYSSYWSYYDPSTTYQDLKEVINRSSGENAGEYIFFPVKDDQIFLPGPTAYDLSPYKLDIICQDLRSIEKENQWTIKRLIIVGDKFHESFVQSEDEHTVLAKSQDVISLSRIATKYPAVTLLDPTDIVLKKILKIAAGRKIVFRATLEGMKEYKKRFYDRLENLGYKNPKKKGILTIGYDLFEDQTEQQTLSKAVDDYFPVVLSKNVHDALIRNGYKKSEFLYVPDLVLENLHKTASEQ